MKIILKVLVLCFAVLVTSSVFGNDETPPLPAFYSNKKSIPLSYSVTDQVQIKAVVVRSWGNGGASGWSDLNSEWSSYGNIPINIDTTTLGGVSSFTYQDLVDTGADVVILGNSAGGLKQFSSEEIEAIHQYALLGHNLVGTYRLYQWNGRDGDLNLDNRGLAPLFGHREDISYNTGNFPISNNFSKLTDSPLFVNMAEQWSSSEYPYTQLPSDDNQWNLSDLLGAEILAESDDYSGVITIYNTDNYTSIYISNLPEYNSTSVNKQLLYNAITSTGNTVKTEQSISFNSIADKTYGDADFVLIATASSSLFVSLSSDSTEICTINNRTVSILSAGTCTLRASQVGNSNYNAASDVIQSFTIQPKILTMTFTAADKIYNGTTVVTAVSDIRVYGVMGGDDTFVSGTETAFFDNANAGEDKKVTASGWTLAGSDSTHYHLATPITTLATIFKANQMITFNSLSDKTYGDADFSLIATASSGLPVTFSSQTSTVCTVNNQTLSLLDSGTCTLYSHQAGNNNYFAAPDQQQSFTVQPDPAQDSDNDGMPDVWEETYGLNPELDDALADQDKDGYSNLREYHAKTNPIDANSFPLWTKISQTGHELMEDNSTWSCIKNNKTGQLWEAKTQANKDDVYRFSEALAYAQSISQQRLCGYQHWIVPSIQQLSTLVDAVYSSPAINQDYFQYNNDSTGAYYWSSTAESDGLLGVSFAGDSSTAVSERDSLQPVRLINYMPMIISPILFLLQ